MPEAALPRRAERSRRRGCSDRRGSAPHRSASDRRPLRGCVIAMARRLFPGAWLRKPYSAQVGRRGAGAGARLSPQSSLRSGRPPQGSRSFPWPAVAAVPLTPAAAGARLLRAAARPAGGGGAGHGRRVSGQGSRWWRRPRGCGAARPPVGSGLSRRLRAQRSAERPAQDLLGGGRPAAPRAHGTAGGAATPAALARPGSPVLCPAPLLYTHRPCCRHPSCQRMDRGLQEKLMPFLTGLLKNSCRALCCSMHFLICS